MKKRMLAMIMAVLMLMSVLTACGNSANAGDSTGNKDAVSIAISSDMGSLDPLHTSGGTDFQIYRNIFDALVKEGPNGVEPALAEDWTMSDDGLSYTFVIRKGVKFHNGEELKASDVVFSISTAQRSPYWADHTASIKQAVATDDNTVVVELNYPYAPFLLAMTSVCIVPEAAYTAAGDSFAQSPIGTGPYKFVSYKTGQSISLTRFDDYYGEPAAIRDVMFQVITESSTALISLETKQVNFAMDLAMSQVKVAESNPEFRVEELESSGLDCLLMNNTVAPFDDLRVRQAFNYAINKENVIAIAQEGIAQPADSPFNKTYFGYSDQIKGYEYNVEKAKSLLADAGYPDGFEVTLKTTDSMALTKDAQSIQEELRQIGVTVKIEMMEGNAYLQDIFNGNYQLGTMSVSSSIADIDNWDQFLTTDGGMNIFKYSNPRVDELFKEARVSSDDAFRKAKYEELTQIVVDDAAMVPLYFTVRTYIADKNLQVSYADGVHGVAAYSLSWAG